MRKLALPVSTLFLAALLAVPAVHAQAGKPPPLPEIPPPPPLTPADALPDTALSPQVTIIQRGDEQVEEFRLQGHLYMIKVTPRHGVPYYLIDERGDGRMIRRDALDERLLVPMWVIRRF